MRATSIAIALGTASASSVLPAAVIAQRAEAALLGAFVSDAATSSLHWIYDVSQIAALVGSGEPEFFSPFSCPYYSYQVGNQSIYGQQMFSYLAIGSSTGKLDPVDIANMYYSTYGPGGPAVAGKWYQDSSTKEFVANMQAGRKWPNCGGQDSQADALAHMLYPTVLYALQDEATRMNAIETVVRVTQNTDDAVAFALAAGRVFYNVLALNMSGPAAVQAAIQALLDPARTHPMAEDASLAQSLQQTLAMAPLPILNVTLAVGQACEYPHNLLSGSYAIATANATGEAAVVQLQSIVRQDIMSGGDNASRNIFVGAVLGAMLGDASLLPVSWTQRTLAFPQLQPMVRAFVQAIKQ
jgi:hypothetical protein